MEQLLTPKVGSIPIFLINLDHRIDRLRIMSSRLDNLPFIRISAIYGQNLDDSKYILQIEKYKMGKNEIAVLLSHRKIWQKILNEKIPYACILEDDVLLSDSFPNFIKNSYWLPDNFDIIKLETFFARVFLSLKKMKARDRVLRQLGSIHAGAAGYIISSQGASKLLDITKHLHYPVDNLMFEVKTINSEIKIFQMCPALCIQENILTPEAMQSSDIESERLKRYKKSQRISGIPKLFREIKRPYFQMLSLIRLVKERLIVVQKVPYL